MEEYTSFVVFIEMNTFISWLLYNFDDAIRRQLRLLSTTSATIAIITTYIRFFCGCYTHHGVTMNRWHKCNNKYNDEYFLLQELHFACYIGNTDIKLHNMTVSA